MIYLFICQIIKLSYYLLNYYYEKINRNYIQNIKLILNMYIENVNDKWVISNEIKLCGLRQNLVMSECVNEFPKLYADEVHFCLFEKNINNFIVQGFRTIVFILIVIFKMIRLICPPAFFRCLSNLAERL